MMQILAARDESGSINQHKKDQKASFHTGKQINHSSSPHETQ
jgi:hypothetical protein